MGNIAISNSFLGKEENMNFTPVKDFDFLGAFEIDSLNGLMLNDHYLPQEVIQKILSYVPPKELLRFTTVCKNWCNFIKCDHFWMQIYNRCYPNKTKQLPWYVYYSFFTTQNYDNLLKNTNGEDKFTHWKVVKNFGDEFRIEDPPAGSDALPSTVKDFNGKTSCFATSFYECNKIQV